MSVQPHAYAAVIAKELTQAMDQISGEEAAALLALLGGARRIFVAGAGRSGLMGKAFAMRLVHTGLQAHVVGETTTPGIEPGDVLMLGSGSGETATLVVMAEKARSIGASVALATLQPDSTLGRLADLTVRLPGAAKDQHAGREATIQPMGSLFEQALLLFYDSLVLGLMAQHSLESRQMYGKHANLE